jgi:hypothetical protein
VSVQAAEEFRDAIRPHALAEHTQRRVVEHRILQGEGTKPAPGQVFGDALTQLALRRHVVDRCQDQRANHDRGMHRGPTDLRIVEALPEAGEGREVEGRVNADKQMLRIKEIASGLACAGVQGTVPPSTVDGLQHGITV